MTHEYCIIMAGGGGNRFWPVSRENKPKQFLNLRGTDTSFLRLTYDRFKGIVPPENIYVITLERYSGKVREILPELPEGNILPEPFSRGTAPCMVYAAATLLKKDPEAVMVATPSDLVITDDYLFSKTIRDAFDYVRQNHVLMTLGVVPKAPVTNFGYIQAKGGQNAYTSTKPLKVKTFVEKPDEELAKVFIRSGEFFWNSGIFIWEASRIMKEMERHTPEVTKLFVGWERNVGTADEKGFIERAYGDCPKVSLDYGIMEKTDLAYLYPAKFGWSDIDSWEAFWESRPDKDAAGNYIDTETHYLDDCSGGIFISKDKKKLIAAKGLDNYIVVDAGDVLMICPKDDEAFRDFLTGSVLRGFDKYR